MASSWIVVGSKSNGIWDKVTRHREEGGMKKRHRQDDAATTSNTRDGQEPLEARTDVWTEFSEPPQGTSPSDTLSVTTKQL